MMNLLVWFLVLLQLTSPMLAENISTDYIFAKQGEVSFFRENGRIGLLDCHGELLIKSTYDGAYPFEGDFSVVQINGKEGVIARNGDQILPCVYQSVQRIESIFQVQMDNLYGIYSKDGTWLLQPTYREMLFRGEFATVRDANGKAGLIDNVGRTIISCKWGEVYHPSNEWSVVIADGMYNFASITHRDALMFDEMQLSVGQFSNGYAPLWISHDMVFLVDVYGRRYSSEVYQSIGGVFPQSGLFTAKKGEHWGVINTSKQIETPFEWDEMDDFSEGLAAVRKGSLWGYIDSLGSIIIPPTYHYVQPFHEGRAVVQSLRGEYQYINQKGNSCGSEYYTEAERFWDGLAVVKSLGSDRYSIINPEGRIVLSKMQWDKVINYRNRLFIAYMDKHSEQIFFIYETGDIVSTICIQ